MSDTETEPDNDTYAFDKDRFNNILNALDGRDPSLLDNELEFFDESLKYLFAKCQDAKDRNLQLKNEHFPIIDEEITDASNSNGFRVNDTTRVVDGNNIISREEDVFDELSENMNNLEMSRDINPNSANDFNETRATVNDFSPYDTESEQRNVEHIYDSESEYTRTTNELNEPHVDFVSFVDDENNYLNIRKLDLEIQDEIANESINYPLGVVYDEISRDWFTCEQEFNKILRFTIRGSESAVSVIEHSMITKPSAVTIYKEGKSIAVLTSIGLRKGFSIYIYDYAAKNIKCFASHKDNRYGMSWPLRGLTKSIGNNLISVENMSGKLRVFKKDVGGFSYKIPNSKNPSFIASRGDQVAVSDLGSNSVYLMRLDDRDWENTTFTVLKVLTSDGFTMDGPICNTPMFQYVAGLQFDRNGNLLIGDARGHTIKLFSNELDFLHRVSSNFAIPFMSSFWVNQQGEMLIIALHDEHKYVYAELGSRPEVSQHIQPNKNEQRQPHNMKRGNTGRGNGGRGTRRPNSFNRGF